MSGSAITGDELAQYLARIDYHGPAQPTLDTLHDVVAAHLRHIPFENLDPLLGIPVEDLSGPALIDKMVRRHRGGYCFEHNSLLRYVLERLGFGVAALTGRVVWMNPAGADADPTALTHMVLDVTVPDLDQHYLVDVGFGGQTLLSPIPFIADQVHRTRLEPYRIRSRPADFVLETQLRDTWLPLYVFTAEPRPLIDRQVGSWYVSTHPASVFVVGLSAALVTADARWNLRGRNLTVHRVGRPSEQVRMDSAAEVVDVLAGRYGLQVDGLGDRAVVLDRIGAVLDT